jgi:PP-loop superfamily ATP-utilizing enzyme
MKLQNRIFLLGLSVALTGGFVFSQIYIHEKNRKELREVAREIALNWKDKLGLSEEQTLLLEDIIIEFTIIKNEIIKSSQEKQAIIQNLQKVQVREYKNLRKILSEPQFDAYVGINKKIPNEFMNSLSNN